MQQKLTALGLYRDKIDGKAGHADARRARRLSEGEQAQGRLLADRRRARAHAAVASGLVAHLGLARAVAVAVPHLHGLAYGRPGRVHSRWARHSSPAAEAAARNRPAGAAVRRSPSR